MCPAPTRHRRIKRNDANYIPRQIVAVDCETTRVPVEGSPGRWTHEFKLACSLTARIARDNLSGLRSNVFRTSQDWWHHLYSLCSARHTVWVVATKTLYDLKALDFQSEFDSGRISLDRPRAKRSDPEGIDRERTSKGLAVIDSPPTIIGCCHVKSGGRIVFVDTLNWFKCGVATLGKACGIDKLPMPDASAGLSDWISYCRRDVEITFRTFIGLIGWCSRNDMGMFKYTASGQAYHAYRHRYMDKEILIHDNEQVKQLERRSYFGGRFSVFKSGRTDQTLWQFDVNSLFPFAMRRTRCPRKLVDTFSSAAFESRVIAGCESDYIADVEIRTSRSIYPIRINNRVVYPTGTFRTTLAGPELLNAIHYGEVIGIASWARYECDHLFDRWVDDLYAMRLEYARTNQPMYGVYVKTLLNSLYGKFGQLAPLWESMPDDDSGIPWTQWRGRHPATGQLTSFRCFGNTVYVNSGKRELGTTFPAISSFITASARSYMNWLRLVCGERNVIYQGCDSLIVTADGRENLYANGLLCNHTLGKLKLECCGNFAEIFGTQDYVLGSKTVIAGRSSRVEYDENNRIMQRRFCCSNDLFKPKYRDAIVERLEKWQRHDSSVIGNVDQDGWVEPFEMMGYWSLDSDSSP